MSLQSHASLQDSRRGTVTRAHPHASVRMDRMQTCSGSHPDTASPAGLWPWLHLHPMQPLVQGEQRLLGQTTSLRAKPPCQRCLWSGQQWCAQPPHRCCTSPHQKPHSWGQRGLEQTSPLAGRRSAHHQPPSLLPSLLLLLLLLPPLLLALVLALALRGLRLRPCRFR